MRHERFSVINNEEMIIFEILWSCPYEESHTICYIIFCCGTFRIFKVTEGVGIQGLAQWVTLGRIGWKFYFWNNKIEPLNTKLDINKIQLFFRILDNLEYL